MQTDPPSSLTPCCPSPHLASARILEEISTLKKRMSNKHEIAKLGIVVVYLVNEEDEGLLDLHLSLIDRYTDLPYTIYGSANRLIPRFLPKLESHPHVELCSYRPTDVRGYQEHAYYLDRLVETAVHDGASHIVMLNVDSFPITNGWAEELASHLDEDCVLAAVKRLENHDEKPHPCCIFFHRDFYLEHRPSLVLSKEELESPEVARYLSESKSIHDTGVGYGFKAFSEGLSWHPLLRSNKAEDHYIIGSIYGDLIFHLGGAAREKKIHLPERRIIDERMSKTRVKLISRTIRFASQMASERMRRLLERFRFYLLFPAAQEALDASERAYVHARRQLLNDPDGYLEYLRSGVRK